MKKNTTNNNNTETLDEIIIGYFLTDSSFFIKAINEYVTTDYFINNKAKNIFNVCNIIYKNNSIESFESLLLYRVILLLIKEKDYGFDVDYLNRCYKTVHDYQNFNFYLQNIIHRYIKSIITQKIAEINREILESDNNTDYLKILDKINNIKNEALTTFNDKSLSMMDLSKKLMEEIKIKEQLGSDPNVFKTGIKSLDRIALFKRGMLAVVWSFTGMGKTTIVLNMLIKWLEQGLKVIFFALEEDAINIYKTLISIVTGYDRASLHNDDIVSFMKNEDKKLRLERSIDFFNKFNTNIKIESDPYVDANTMLIKATRFKADIVIIDNMNNIRINTQYREQEYSRVANSLNAFSIETNSLIVLVQQANRELNRPNNFSGLKYASATADYSTTVIGIYTPSEDFKYKEDKNDKCDVFVRENNINIAEVMYVYNCKGRRTGSGYSVMKYNKSSGYIGDF